MSETPAETIKRLEDEVERLKLDLRRLPPLLTVCIPLDLTAREIRRLDGKTLIRDRTGLVYQVVEKCVGYDETQRYISRVRWTPDHCGGGYWIDVPGTVISPRRLARLGARVVKPG